MHDIPILMYHDISDANNPWCVSPKDFEEQMHLLKREGYSTISLAELNERIKQSIQTDKKVVITFDDARKSIFTTAYPILKKFNFTAAVFIVPQWIDGKAPDAEQYSSFMSWEEVKKLAAHGFEIGSHTFSHKRLTTLDEKSIAHELDEADAAIEKNMGKKTLHFAYPYGSYNQKILDIITKRYMTAVTARRGFDKSPGEFARQWVTHHTSLEKFNKLLKAPTLSICMIVRNEENSLKECLKSIKDMAHEIILVDTGSTDNTKAIAHEFTDKVYDYKWNDDFSAARNESLKHATGDWILVIDADERIDNHSCQLIQEAINNRDISAYQMMTKNYTNDSTITGWQPDGWFPSVKVRLFQRDAEVKFEGEIHEMVENTVKGKIAMLDMPIHHYGAAKSEKYIEMTKKKIAANPSAKAFFELGVQYKDGGKLEDAENAFRQSIELSEDSVYQRLNLAIVQQKQNKIEEAIKNYSNVIQKDEKSADAHFGLGFCYFKKNELQKAAEYFEKTIGYNQKFLDAHINLGAVYEKLNKFQEAANALKNALKLSPKNGRAYYNLGVIHEKTSNIEKAIACYQKAIDFNYKKEELKEKIEQMKELGDYKKRRM